MEANRLYQELDFAQFYYQNLIMNLSATFFNHDKELFKVSAKQIVYKCLVYLGDIARYRALNQTGKRVWTESWNWYEKAIEFNSIGGILHVFL